MILKLSSCIIVIYRYFHWHYPPWNGSEGDSFPIRQPTRPVCCGFLPHIIHARHISHHRGAIHSLIILTTCT